jgi:thiosulfate dehydrogenase
MLLQSVTIVSVLVSMSACSPETAPVAPPETRPVAPAETIETVETVATVTPAAPPAAATPHWSYDPSKLPDDEASRLILRGKAIADATAKELPAHVGNGLRCTNCHLGAGTTPHAAAWVGVTDRYPQYRARTGKDDTIEERINDCFERSMNGKALPPDSEGMKALVAWMTWLSKDVDGKALSDDAKIPLSKLKRDADPVRGKLVYDTRCASCHGPTGAGITAADGSVVFPALSGKATFNIGAGMARLRSAAGFIKHNMPLGQGNTLTDDEAFDVAWYVTRLERPDFADKANDWPKGGKPDDARY